MNTRLANQNRSLADQVQGFFRSLELPAGAQVPPLIGTDRDGGDIVVDLTTEDQPVLLLVFSPFCPACDQNWPNWRTLLAAQQASGGRVVPVDITGLAQDDYLRRNGIDRIPIVVDVTPETNMAYRFRFTPQTLILHEGELIGGWTGVLTEENLSRGLTLLGVDSTDIQVRPTLVTPRRPAPACDGLMCRVDADCGTRCSCEGATDGSTGMCTARPGA